MILVAVILFVELLELTFILSLAMVASLPIPPFTDADDGQAGSTLHSSAASF